MVPRSWLIALAALLIVPWLIVAGVYWWEPISHWRSGSSGTASDASSNGSAGPHPWGQLESTPIVISPPLEYVRADWARAETPRWFFPQMNRAQVEQFLSQAGLDQQQVASLLAASQSDARIGGLAVTPDRDLVRNLNPDVRAQLYRRLNTIPLNRDRWLSYHHFATSAEAWLGPAPISPETFQSVAPYIYRFGGFVYFDDIDFVQSEIADPAELRRLLKGLFRDASLLVKVHIPDASRLNEVAEYWGRGGRRTDIRPLLESIAAGGPAQSIDISHLLPSLARQHLYRYPQLTLKDFEKPSLANCFWTAMNFFSNVPDDRFLNPDYALERLKTDYYFVSDNFQLGDVMVFSNSKGELFHACVYLADNLVFGKNGYSPMAPWTIVPIDRLKGYYPDQADDWNMVCYRRKDM